MSKSRVASIGSPPNRFAVAATEVVVAAPTVADSEIGVGGSGSATGFVRRTKGRLDEGRLAFTVPRKAALKFQASNGPIV